MLTSELKNKIDEKWDACWPISKLRPIFILDLISYLFFIRKVNENQLVGEIEENKSDDFFPNSKDGKYLNSSFLNVPDGHSKHAHFAGEIGNSNLKKDYSYDLTYGLFVKGDVLMAPTHKLSGNAEEILKIIEEGDDDLKGEIFDYLLYKAEIKGTNGQAYLPELLVELMVSIIQPSKKDFILNAAAGNGSLLVGCIKYIARRNILTSGDNFDSRKLVGIESDLTGLRIAGMNMILHGIHNPELIIPDTNTPLKNIITRQPSVVVANLIFAPDDDKINTEINSGNETINKEIYYLNFILKNLEAGTRAVIIVSEITLYHPGSEFTSIRREIVNNCKLDAILYLGGKNFSNFFGTSILIFSKEATVKTDKVWFCKIENDAENFPTQYDEFEDILSHFKNKDYKKRSANQESFFINADEIISKDYNLSYKVYHLIKKEPPPDYFPNNSLPAIKEVLNDKDYTIPLESTADEIKKATRKYIMADSKSLSKPIPDDLKDATKKVIAPDNKVLLKPIAVKTKKISKKNTTANSKIPLKVIPDETKDATKKERTPNNKVLLKPTATKTKEPSKKNIIAHSKIPPKVIPDETKDATKKGIAPDNKVLLKPIAPKTKEPSKKNIIASSTIPSKVIPDEIKDATKRGIIPDNKVPLKSIAAKTKEPSKKNIAHAIEISFKSFASQVKEVIKGIKPVAAEKKEANKVVTNQTLVWSIPKNWLSQKIPVKKIISVSGLAIIFICIVYWGLFYKNDIFSQGKPDSISAVVPDSSNKSSVFNSASKHSIDSIINVINNYAAKDSANGADAKYTVISKAYFYSSPDQTTKQKQFINNLSNDTLIPIKANNDFIFVDYINMNGESIKGWLNKNDLITVLPEATQNIVHNEINTAEKTYRTKSKAYFYRLADIGKRSSLYLGQSNPTILTPLKEENGFVYVIYTNTRGKTTKGRLNKKDLIPVN
ncbi:MAG: N-6 DNA methylase [Ginsengibacter sp.]